MMLPATTASLPNRFTPSRLLTLSRPFLTLPCPFLCAILEPVSYCPPTKSFRRFFRCGLFSAHGDGLNLQPGQFTPMSHGPVVTFASLVFESDNLLILPMFHHFGGDF